MPNAAFRDQTMWIYSKSRGENDNRFLINLDLSSRVNLSQLGEHWFIEVMQGSDSHPIASTTSREEAVEIQKRIFEAMKAGEQAIDLDMEAESKANEQKNDPKGDCARVSS
jgi:hypothetical protein